MDSDRQSIERIISEYFKEALSRGEEAHEEAMRNIEEMSIEDGAKFIYDTRPDLRVGESSIMVELSYHERLAKFADEVHGVEKKPTTESLLTSEEIEEGMSVLSETLKAMEPARNCSKVARNSFEKKVELIYMLHPLLEGLTKDDASKYYRLRYSYVKSTINKIYTDFPRLRGSVYVLSYKLKERRRG